SERSRHRRGDHADQREAHREPGCAETEARRGQAADRCACRRRTRAAGAGCRMNASSPVLTLRELDSRTADFDAQLDALIRFEAAQDPAIDATVASIIADVRARGDDAVLECTA